MPYHASYHLLSSSHYIIYNLSQRNLVLAELKWLNLRLANIYGMLRIGLNSRVRYIDYDCLIIFESYLSNKIGVWERPFFPS